jgi:hypothetical protein
MAASSATAIRVGHPANGVMPVFRASITPQQQIGVTGLIKWS